MIFLKVLVVIVRVIAENNEEIFWEFHSYNFYFFRGLRGGLIVRNNPYFAIKLTQSYT